MTSWHEYRQYELENGGMDDPPYCPLCGTYTTSGVLCEKCRSEDPGDYMPDVCHCGLTAEEHVYPTVDHNFTPKDEPVFTHCNVCGRKLHTDEEDRIGMCEVCGNL
jgi:hypothetical protein